MSVYTINSWGRMHDALLIHDGAYMAVSAYGSVYIPRALRAQFSKEGYNYGGAPKVATLAQASCLLGFNLEQQANLIADYWRLSEDGTGWG
ncbi:MAG: hypothetical protein R2795_17645 [Saprospiraceae bacterium]